MLKLNVESYNEKRYSGIYLIESFKVNDVLFYISNIKTRHFTSCPQDGSDIDFEEMCTIKEKIFNVKKYEYFCKNIGEVEEYLNCWDYRNVLKKALLSKINIIEKTIDDEKELDRIMWKNINVNSNQIVIATDKSYLVKCPNNSKYSGFVFWHPAKCVRQGRNSYALSLGYTDDFVFRLKKYGKGKTNFDKIIEEKEINSKEFEEIFGVTDKNIINCIGNEVEEIVHVPEYKKPIDNPIACKELIDD